MTDKKNFIFYTEWTEQIHLLAECGTAQDIVTLFDALKEYVESGIVCEMSPLIRAIFNQVRAQIDRNNEKYERTAQKRKDAAASRWMQKDANDANASKCINDDANDADNVDVDDDVDVDVEEDDDVSPNGDNIHSSIEDASTALALPQPQFIAETDPSKMTDKTLEEEFDALWRLYPRKAGKADALRHYKAARRKGASYDDIEDGVLRYADYVRGQDPQYIAMGSTWFNGHRWEDQYVRKKTDLERLWDL